MKRFKTIWTNDELSNVVVDYRALYTLEKRGEIYSKIPNNKYLCLVIADGRELWFVLNDGDNNIDPEFNNIKDWTAFCEVSNV